MGNIKKGESRGAATPTAFVANQLNFNNGGAHG